MRGLNKSKKTFDFSVLSSQRLIVVGIAALLVVLFHSYKMNLNPIAGESVFLKVICTAFGLIKPAGNVGVELFLLCSGLGLFYSFSKNGNVMSFYKKRAIRILPPLLIVSSVYYAFADIGAKEYFSSVSLLDFFIKGKTDFWYFALLIILYALYPIIHKFVAKQKDIVVIGVILALILINFVLCYALKLPLGTRFYALLRVPTFIIGVWLGKKSFEGKQIRSFWISVCMLVAIVCFALVSAMHTQRILLNFTNGSYLYYFINIPFSVALMVIISAFSSKVGFRFIKSVIAVFGTLSLELYLLFERVTELLESYVNLHDITFVSFYTVAFVVTVLLSVVLHGICKNITSVFSKNYQKLK